MRRLRSALNVLFALSENEVTGGKHTVECRPEAWRCSVCGGGLIGGPKGKPMVHVHSYTHDVACRGSRSPFSVRYVGVRAHARRVWGSVWDNRPRVVRRPRSGSYGVVTEQRLTEREARTVRVAKF